MEHLVTAWIKWKYFMEHLVTAGIKWKCSMEHLVTAGIKWKTKNTTPSEQLPVHNSIEKS